MHRRLVMVAAVALVLSFSASSVSAAPSTSFVRITTDPQLELAPAWSPDGSRLAFLSYQDNARGEIYLMTAATHQVMRLTTNGGGPFGTKFSPLAWSPDGTRIAFTERDSTQETGCCPRDQAEIYLVDVRTGQTTDLTNTYLSDPNVGPVNTIDEGGPIWSPDGTTIAFTSNRDRVSALDIFLMNADGSNVRRVTNDVSSSFIFGWSPDGSTLLAMRDDGILVMHPDGSHVRSLGRGFSPAWSPNGAQIAFFRDVVPGYSDVWTMNADGTGVIDVSRSKGTIAADFSWSPDSKQLAYTLQDGPGTFSDIFVADRDGSGRRDITKLGSTLSLNPAWAPAGHLLALVSDRNAPGNVDVYLTNP